MASAIMAPGNRVLCEPRTGPILRAALAVAAIVGVLAWSAVAAEQTPDGEGRDPVAGQAPLAAEETPADQIQYEPLPPSSGLATEVPPIRPAPRRGPLLERLGVCRPRGRYLGPGQPLLRESWQYRPFSIGWYMGAMQGGTLVDDWTGADAGYFGGYRLGWDYDYYWGCEFRAGLASLPEWDSARAKAAQVEADNLAGVAPDNPWRSRYDRSRNVDVNLWDASLLYYPWGDSTWRPYALVGLGAARVAFEDRLATDYDETLFSMPMGLGLKYRCNNRVALRLECLDNIFVGSGDLETTHNVSLNAGVEIRFGGPRKAYWPFNPSNHYW
jgi:opacity protein-like surface antigen